MLKQLKQHKENIIENKIRNRNEGKISRLSFSHMKKDRGRRQMVNIHSDNRNVLSVYSLYFDFFYPI